MNASTPDEDGYTPLHMAAFAEVLGERRSRIEAHAVSLWDRLGAAVDQVSVEGVTPPHIAASLYDKDAVEFLLSKGADPLRRTKDGRTPIQMAQRSEHGTGLFGMSNRKATVRQKAATIDALRASVRQQSAPQ